MSSDERFSAQERFQLKQFECVQDLNAEQGLKTRLWLRFRNSPIAKRWPWTANAAAATSLSAAGQMRDYTPAGVGALLGRHVYHHTPGVARLSHDEERLLVQSAPSFNKNCAYRLAYLDALDNGEATMEGGTPFSGGSPQAGENFRAFICMRQDSRPS
jgi:hypothetical protein